MLLALPLVTVAVDCFALFIVGAQKPYLGARVYGGPTEGAKVISLRVAAVERLQESEAPLRPRAVRLTATFNKGQRFDWQGRLDEQGMAHVTLRSPDPVSGQLRLDVALADGAALPLASGRIKLEGREWLRYAKSQGGWLRGRQTGDLRVMVAAGRGAFAVPFADPVLLRVSDERGAVAGAELGLQGEGLVVERPASKATLRSDALGHALGSLRPLEHAVALHVTARAPDGRSGTWYATLPVIPGAFHAQLEDGKLRIESPIRRDVAYVAILSPEAELSNSAVPLTPDARGGAYALLQLPPLDDRPHWAVVSSEAELNSPSAVGWPLAPSVDTAEPLRTWTVPEALLLDGLIRGYALDQRRKLRARLLAGVFTAAAAGLLVVLLVLTVRRSEADLAAHLREASDGAAVQTEQIQRSTGLALLAAALCMVLGLASVALIAMYRIQ